MHDDTAIRPLLLGYVRVHQGMTEAELVRAKDRLHTFAQVEGFAMGAVFTEYAETAPAAFHALVDAVKRHEVRAIVVPSRRHLAVLGALPTLERYLECCTGAPVLTVDRS